MTAGQTNFASNHSANSKRPLPSTPVEHCDTEYDYIDESHVLNSQTPGQAAENAYLKLQAVRTVGDGSTFAAADGDGYEIPVKPREAKSLEVKHPVSSSRQRVPARAQTVHTTRPGSRQEAARLSQVGKGQQQDGRAGPCPSRPGGATRSGSQALDRRGSHSYCLNDLNYDTSF